MVGLSELSDSRVIDCHVHAWMLRKGIDEASILGQTEALVEIIEEGRLEALYAFDSRSHLPLYLKARHSGLFYAGGYAPWTGRTDKMPAPDWGSYIPRLMELGYDGIGEMGSKPATRDVHVPLDAPYYRGFCPLPHRRRRGLLARGDHPQLGQGAGLGLLPRRLHVPGGALRGDRERSGPPPRPPHRPLPLPLPLTPPRTSGGVP